VPKTAVLPVRKDSIYPRRRRQNAGMEGEMLAAEALQKKGMQVIGRNIRSKMGEIDLIALDEDVLVFVEVKNWRAYGMENLRFGITPQKQRRIIETAKYFLASNRKYSNSLIRFDVVFLRPGEPMVHLVSAFSESQ